MIVHTRRIVKVKDFLFSPLIRNISPRSVSKNCFGCFSTSCPRLDSYSPSRHDQTGKGVDHGIPSDIDFVISKALAANSESEVIQSLAGEYRCNSIQITHVFVKNLLCRFQDDWKSALGVFKWVKTCWGYEPLPESYDKVVDILGKMKQMERMKAFVDEMHEGHLVSLNTIARMMRRFAGAGDWKEAIKTFDDLQKFGLEKNTESMNILLDTLCKEEKVDLARGVFMELKRHIPPNANTYNIFIHGWCKIRRVEEAHWTIQEMKGNGLKPCVISYSTIIQYYCFRGEFLRVYELLDEMEAEKCPPNVVTFTTIMHCLTKSEDYDGALKIAKRMKSVGCKPDIQFYNALIHTLGRAHRIDEAVSVFTKEIPENELIPNTSTYGTMIAMFCHHKEEQRARRYLKSLEYTPSCKPDAQSFYPLLKLYFQSGKIDKCLILLDEMVKKHHLCFDLATYTLVIHGLCRGNECKRAYGFFKDMIGQNITPRYVTCTLLLKEVREKDMFDAAEVIEDYMKTMKSSRMKRRSGILLIPTE